MSTCMPSSDNLMYMFLNMVAEVGEIAGKLAKWIRKGKIAIDCNNIVFDEAAVGQEKVDMMEELKLEVGDVMWQLSGFCMTMSWDIEEVAQMNLDKLASRKQRGVIDGSGDNR